MKTLRLHLGVPSHAVEPALLAQRLPRLTAALRGFSLGRLNAYPATEEGTGVYVHAAQLGVQRDHVTLECLPALDTETFEKLQALAASLVAEFATQDLRWDAATGSPVYGSALGRLYVNLALPPVANFIGRDITRALPRREEARVLRQFVNASQMALNQSPIAGSAVNSLWCANPLPEDVLSQTWLQGGLTAWWDALPAWDAALDLSALNPSKAYQQFEVIYSDVSLYVIFKPRPAWAVWAKPLQLAKVLQQAELVAN